MVTFRPFKGILPKPEFADQVVTRSFDSYSRKEIKSILESAEFSFLHVILPVAEELRLKQLSYEERLRLGKKEFEHLISSGVLKKQEEQAYFIYQQTDSDGGVFKSILGAASVSDYENGRIKKHEETLEYKEIVLKEYLEVIDIHAEPVYLIIPDSPDLLRLLDKLSIGEPDVSVTLNNQKHEVWSVSDVEHLALISSIFQQTSVMYIADGHHRCASSSLYGKQRRELNPHHTGVEAYNGFLAAVIPESWARLYEFSRLVKDLGSHTTDSFLESLRKHFFVEQVDISEVTPKSVHEFGLYISGKALRLRLKEHPTAASPLDNLDPFLLNRFIFEPKLGISDLRKDKRVKFIGGKADICLLKKEVDSGKFKAAFLSYPVPFRQFKEIADAGLVMPPKSTWFEPKFPSALVIYPLQD